MRQLTLFDDERQARRLGDALFMEGVDNTVNEARDERFAVWVHDDEKMATAREVLAEFEADPGATRFNEATKRAGKQRSREQATQKRARAQAGKMRKRMATDGQRGLGSLTMFLILACVGVAFLTSLGDTVPGSVEAARSTALRIGDATRPTTELQAIEFHSLGLDDHLAPVMAGQVWRLLTPIFLHFGALHLVFNLFMLGQLGTLVERRHSTPYLLGLVLAMALVSNFAQLVVSGPLFGGMSGVVYGLFGFLWIRGRFDRSYGFTLQKSTVTIMMGWFVLAFVLSAQGSMAIANTAHAGGLAVGAGWGYLSSGDLRRRLS